MSDISTLILFPLIVSVIVYLVKSDSIRNVIVRISAFITAALTLFVTLHYFQDGIALSLPGESVIDSVITVIEIFIAVYIITAGIKNKKYIVSVFAFLQTTLMLWFDYTYKHQIKIGTDIVFDKLSGIMVLIVGVIGSLICLYAVGYMKWYHVQHSEYKARKPFFFAVLFLFLSAMFGLVLSNNLIWMYFCWEVTSLSSYLLIGYTKTEEAKNNSFLALFINLGGGLAFAVAIVIIGIRYNTLELSVLTQLKPEPALLVAVFLLCIAALTKSAQIPFSSWLLGAMVAPTPSSALLHSATMVKAGVFINKACPFTWEDFCRKNSNYIRSSYIFNECPYGNFSKRCKKNTSIFHYFKLRINCDMCWNWNTGVIMGSYITCNIPFSLQITAFLMCWFHRTSDRKQECGRYGYINEGF